MTRRVFSWLSVGCALASALAALVVAWMVVGVADIATTLALPFFILPVLMVLYVRLGLRWLWVPMALVAGVEALLVPLFWPFTVVPVLACVAVALGTPLLILPREVAPLPATAD